MKLPVNKLETKNYTIGQKVLMVKHFDCNIELKKQGIVIAITDKTLIVKSDEEIIFTENTLSVQGEYVLFPSVEAYENYVHTYNKFEVKKNELLKEIGNLTDGLTFEDVENLILTVKMIKQFDVKELKLQQPVAKTDVLYNMDKLFNLF